MSRHMPALIPSALSARPVRLIEQGAQLEGRVGSWAKANAFAGNPGQFLLVPGADGEVLEALFGTGTDFDPMSLRALAAKLPGGCWILDWSRLGQAAHDQADVAALAFALGGYVFDRYKSGSSKTPAQLVVDAKVDIDSTLRIAAACALARQMIDTPAADMGPAQIESIAREIAHDSGASFSVTEGGALLEDNYPAVHAVGRAAADHRAPRVIEMGWNLDRTDYPLIALVGKGVVFDTGGLDLKPAAGMRNMKKDMGGAAHVLGLGRLIMEAGLSVRLVVLVAAVENAVSADAFRPGDILSSRKGLTIEIGNTDAEGRLVLADILTRAEEHEPDLTLDFATLTGAARIALGPELPPLYTDDAALADDLLKASVDVSDPVWRMPLWAGYRSSIDSEIADIRNDSAGWAQAGSVTAALFLQRFAPATGSWAHLDVFAWNPRSRPGWPEGGEVQGLRAVFEMLRRRYG